MEGLGQNIRLRQSMGSPVGPATDGSPSPKVGPATDGAGRRLGGRWARQEMLPEVGEDGQRRIAASSVLIVGLGGLGAPVALYLTGAGVGRIGLMDPDAVSESNLQRQVLYDVSQLGQSKAQAAFDRLSALSPDTVFDVMPHALTQDNADIVADYDLIVDCCDNFPTRYLLDDACAKHGKPWVYGSIGEFSGQVCVMNWHKRVRYSDLFQDREALCAQPRVTQGVLGPVPGVVGSIQASEALKLLAGFGSPLDGKLFTIDLKTMETAILTF